MMVVMQGDWCVKCTVVVVLRSLGWMVVVVIVVNVTDDGKK